MEDRPERETLYLRAFREIRAYMIRNQLKPGDLLPSEQELCRNLGVSRNVLREAIKSMELMGMVRACPGRGTEVQSFSMDFIIHNVLFFNVGENSMRVREMLDIRRVIELTYMRQAFHSLQEEDITELRRCTDRIRRSYEETGFFSEADRDFHLTLFRPLHNEVLLSTMEAIWAVDNTFQLDKKQPHLAESVLKHEAIVDAVEQWDYRAFARAMERHFSSGKYLGIDSYEEY